MHVLRWTLPTARSWCRLLSPHRANNSPLHRWSLVADVDQALILNGTCRLRCRAAQSKMVSAEYNEDLSRSCQAGVSIRLACTEDVPRLYEIIQAAYRGKRSWTTEAHLVRGERISQDDLRQVITELRDKVFVAYTSQAASGSHENSGASEETLLGCICAEWAKHHADLELPHDAAMLGLFAVDPVYQSHGVGRTLIAHAERFVQSEWLCSRVVLWVIEHRLDILAWYKRREYAATGQRVPFVMPELELVDGMQFCVLQKELQ